MPDPALELLRAALGQRRARLKERRAARPRNPRAAERASERDLRALSRQISKEIAATLRPHLRERQDADLDLGTIGLDLAGLRVRILRLIRRRAPGLAASMAGRIEKANAKDLERIIALSFSGESPAIQAALARFRAENVALIESIATRQLDQVERLVLEAGTSGMRVETLAKRLIERFRVSASRAELIARDQTLKLNGQLTQERHQEAGISRYIWSTSRDERVRPIHQELEGQVFSWSDPPVTNAQGETNHPGEDYQCRCVAIPVVAN